VRIAADTNVLLRAAVGDDPGQEEAALGALAEAELVAVGLASLCEFAWVLAARYEVQRDDIAEAIRGVLARRNVAVNRPAVEAGLSMLEAGGDFADGVIAYEGQWLGGETFVSFDRKAVKVLEAQGRPARLLP
jgi:predicted nucleic-acid-binding protein